MDTQELQELEAIVKALANHRRLAIVQYLKHESFAPVFAIAEEIGLTLKATSQHLKILTLAGILRREPQGMRMLYRLDVSPPKAAQEIIRLL